jgi:hypothetical protein
MKQLQKIAIGLLGLTNPEIFIPRSKSNATAATEIESDSDLSLTGSARSREGRGRGLIRALKFMGAALTIGSRTVARADNSELRRDLSARLLVTHFLPGHADLGRLTEGAHGGFGIVGTVA